MVNSTAAPYRVTIGPVSKATIVIARADRVDRHHGASDYGNPFTPTGRAATYMTRRPTQTVLELPLQRSPQDVVVYFTRPHLGLIIRRHNQTRGDLHPPASSPGFGALQALSLGAPLLFGQLK